MGLVDHVRHLLRTASRWFIIVLFGAHQFVENQEQFKRIDRSHDEVIIRIFAVVEVKSAQPALIQQHRHNVLDVGALRMMPGVHQDVCLFAHSRRCQIGQPPVGEIGVVKRRLEKFVFNQHPFALRQRGVHLGQGLKHALLASAKAVLPGIIRPIGEPERQIAGAGFLHNFDAFQHVLHGHPANRGIGMADGAKFVGLILEDVRIDGADADAQLIGVLFQRVPVIHTIPRDVQRHRRRHTGEAVHHGGIGQLLFDCTRSAGPGEHPETCAAVTIAPRRRFDVLAFKGGFNGFQIEPPLIAPGTDGIHGSLRPTHDSPPSSVIFKRNGNLECVVQKCNGFVPIAPHVNALSRD